MDRESLLRAAAELITRNFPAQTRDGMLAARVGVLLRREYPEGTLEACGFYKLKHILDELAARGLIRVGPNSKQALAIWLPESEEQESETAVADQTRRRRPSVKDSLRKDVWNAFVLELPNGKRFINRKTGAVQIGVVDKPLPDYDWVEIPNLSREEQVAWAREYLESNGVESAESLTSALNEPDWFIRFPARLAEQSRALMLSWNRNRTERVVAKVQKWRSKENIPEALLFDVEQRPKFATGGATSSTISRANPRRIVLDALHRMSTEDLLAIPIPAGLIFEELGLTSSAKSGGERE